MEATLDASTLPDVPLSGVDKGIARFEYTHGLARRHRKQIIGHDTNPEKCWGDFLLQVRDARSFLSKRRRDAVRRLEGVYKSHYQTVEKSAMGESSGVIGGYLIPSAFSSEIMVGVAERSVFRRHGALVVECQSGMDNELPGFDYGNVTNATFKVGQPPYWGGLYPQITIGTSRPESEPLFRQISLRPWQISFNAYESNTMRQDMTGGAGIAPSTEDMLIAGFAEATAYMEDYLFFQGNGVGQPLGIVNAPGTLLVTRGGAGSISAANTQNMLGSILPLCAENAIWAACPTALKKISAITAWVPNVAGPLCLHGRPVVQSAKPSPVGSIGDLLYFDPRMYAIGVKVNVDMLLDFSDQVPTPFLANQSVWRMNHRVDGQPRLATTVTLEDQSTVVAAYVGLTT